MAEWAPKVFRSEVTVVEAEDGFAVRLDGRPVRTPGKQLLAMPNRPMAEAVAAEWEAQEETVDPRTMPATRAVNSAIDKVAPQHGEVAALIAAYGETDLLCYRADGPKALAERQRIGWDPLLDWAADVLDARLKPVAGVMPVDQDAGALAALSRHVVRHDNFGLTALSDLVGLSGSLVLGLADEMGRLAPAEAWDLSRLDETFQAEQWGADEDAEAAAAVKREAFFFAHRFAGLAQPGRVSD